jgi:hypothetical protein
MVRSTVGNCLDDVRLVFLPSLERALDKIADLENLGVDSNAQNSHGDMKLSLGNIR